MIEHDPVQLPLSTLLTLLDQAEAVLPPSHSMTLPTRVINLPLAFNERWTHEAIAKYMRSVRSEAPYLPSNVDFIAANNGLEGPAAVKKSVLDTTYLVLGLGDVYLGAPCAVPIDPRQRWGGWGGWGLSNWCRRRGDWV